MSLGPSPIASSSSASEPENLISPSSVEHCGKRRVVTPEKQQSKAKKQRQNSSRSDVGSDSVSRNRERGLGVSNAVEGIARAPRNDSVQNRICEPMVEMHALGITEPVRKCVARLAGYKDVTSGGFSPAMKDLKLDRIIENGPQGRYILSKEGLSSLPVVPKPKSNDEKQERLLKLVTKIAGGSKDKAKRIFNVLKDRQVHYTSDVAASTNYSGPSSGGFAPIMKAFKDLDLVRIAGKGLIQMTDLAFQDETVEPVQPSVKTEDTQATISTDGTSIIQRELPSIVLSNNVKAEDSGAAEPVPSSVKFEDEGTVMPTVGAVATQVNTAEPAPSHVQSNVPVETVTSYSTVASSAVQLSLFR